MLLCMAGKVYKTGVVSYLWPTAQQARADALARAKAKAAAAAAAAQVSTHYLPIFSPNACCMDGNI